MISMTSETEKNTVIELLRSLPDDGLLSIGMGIKPLSRDELIECIKKEDEIGKKIVDVYMTYLRSLKEIKNGNIDNITKL